MKLLKIKPYGYFYARLKSPAFLCFVCMQFVFNWLAKKASPVFAVFFIACVNIFFTSVYGVFIAFSFPEISSYLTGEILLGSILTFLVFLFLLAVHTGVFSRLGLKGGDEIVRFLNKNANHLLDPKLLQNTQALLIHNRLAGLSAHLRKLSYIYGLPAIVLLSGFVYGLNFKWMPALVILFSGLVVLALFAHFMLSLSDLMIGPLRGKIEHILLERRLSFRTYSKVSLQRITGYLILFVSIGAIILAVYCSGSNRSIAEISAFLTVSILIFGAMTYLHLRSLNSFLNRISQGMDRLAHNQEAFVVANSVASEVVGCARHFNIAAREMVYARNKMEKYNQVLERSVEERTKELTRKNKELEEQQAQIISHDEEIRTQSDIIQEYNRSLSHINESLELQRQIIERKNLDITDSIKYAHHIQNSLLPSEEKLKKIFHDSFIFYMPRDIISGDFYWFTRQNGKIVIIAADCTGHGVPGALMSMIGITLLHRIVEFSGTLQPAEILQKLDEELNAMLANLHQEKSHDGMDISVCTIDLKTNHCFISGAQRPLYIVRQGQLMEYSRNVFSVGGYYERVAKNFTEHEMQLLPGDMIYLFTDGYTSQFGGKKLNKFENKRFKSLLTDISRLEIREQKRRLDYTLREWKGPEEQIDDILVMGFRYENRFYDLLAQKADGQENLEFSKQ